MSLDVSTNEKATKPTGFTLVELKNITTGSVESWLEIPEDLLFEKDSEGERSLGPAFTKFGAVNTKYGENYTLVPIDDPGKSVIKNLWLSLKLLDLPCRYHATLDQRFNNIVEAVTLLFGKFKAYVIRDLETLEKHIRWVERVRLETPYSPEFSVNYRLSKLTEEFEELAADNVETED